MAGNVNGRDHLYVPGGGELEYFLVVFLGKEAVRTAPGAAHAAAQLRQQAVHLLDLETAPGADLRQFR